MMLIQASNKASFQEIRSMNRLLYILLFTILATVSGTADCFAQSSARDCLRLGNKYYRDKQYNKAETYYLKSVESVPSFEGYYNLGNAYALQGKDSTAYAMYLRADSIGSSDPMRKARNYHNMGNLMYAQGVAQMRSGGNEAANAFQSAVNYYKSSLRCNPEDNETRYNLAMAQYQLKKNQNNNQNQNQNQDKNKNQDQDKNKDQQNQDKNKDQQDKNNDQNKDNKDKQDKQNQDKNKEDENKQQPPQNNNANKQQDKGGVSDQVAEQLLNSAQQDEKGVQHKVNKNNNARRRNLEKDW